MERMPRLVRSILLLLLIQPASGWATEQKSEPFPDLGLLHREPDAPVLQEFWLLGRYHGQYHATKSGAESEEAWEDRRFRLGFQARLFQRLTIHAQAVSGSDFEPFYNGFTELWAGWKFSDAVTLTVGQQKHRFTHDRNVSSRYINHLERGMLTNMFALDYTPAVTLSGNLGKNWSYYTGVFSNATDRNIGRAFTELDSGYSFLASGTRDLGSRFGTDTAHVNVAYLHSDAKASATNLNRFEHGLNTALILTEGSKSLVARSHGGTGRAWRQRHRPELAALDLPHTATADRGSLSAGSRRRGTITASATPLRENRRT